MIATRSHSRSATSRMWVEKNTVYPWWQCSAIRSLSKKGGTWVKSHHRFIHDPDRRVVQECPGQYQFFVSCHGSNSAPGHRMASLMPKISKRCSMRFLLPFPVPGKHPPENLDIRFRSAGHMPGAGPGQNRFWRFAFKGFLSISIPATLTLPESGCSSPTITLMAVVFSGTIRSQKTKNLTWFLLPV